MREEEETRQSRGKEEIIKSDRVMKRGVITNDTGRKMKRKNNVPLFLLLLKIFHSWKFSIRFLLLLHSPPWFIKGVTEPRFAIPTGQTVIIFQWLSEPPADVFTGVMDIQLNLMHRCHEHHPRLAG